MLYAGLFVVATVCIEHSYYMPIYNSVTRDISRCCESGQFSGQYHVQASSYCTFSPNPLTVSKSHRVESLKAQTSLRKLIIHYVIQEKKGKFAGRTKYSRFPNHVEKTCQLSSLPSSTDGEGAGGRG